jgi:hypothetical protein
MPSGGSTGSSKSLYNNQQFTTLWLIGGYDCNMHYNPVKSAAATNVDLRVMGGAEIYKTLCVRGNIIGNVCAKKIQVDLITDKKGHGIDVKSNIDMNCFVVGNVKVLEVEIITNKPMSDDILMIPHGNVILAPQSEKTYIISNMYVSGNINMTNTNINNVKCIDVYKIQNIVSNTILSSANIDPTITDTYDLGNLTHKWRHMYTQDITICGNVYGNIHANALPVWVPDATSNLNMHCFTIANCMALHVHDLYGKSPIEVHDNFNMNATILGNGGRITWNSGVQIGNLNTFAGYSSSIALGKNVNAFGNYSLCVGYNSKSYGYQSVVIGPNVMTNVTGYNYNNVAIGSNNFSQSQYVYGYNVVIGHGIANKYTTSSAYDSILIGRWVGQYAQYSMGKHNIAIGAYAMQYQGYNYYGGSKNISIGFNSTRRGTYGHNNVAIGNDALGSVSGTLKYANNMIAIGDYAGYCLDSSTSIAIGGFAMSSVFSSRNYTFTSKSSLAIGYKSLRNIISGADYNMAIGHFAMGRADSQDYAYFKTTGTRNTCLGFEAGKNISFQNRNVFIGHRAGHYDYGSDSVAIGYTTHYASSVGNKGVRIGANSHVYQNGTGVGFNAYCARGAVSVGKDSHGTGYYSISVGILSSANVTSSIAIGSAYYNFNSGATASGIGAISIGSSIYAEGGYVNGPRSEGVASIAIGCGTNETLPTTIQTTRALKAECIAIGRGAIASGVNVGASIDVHCSSIAIGASTRAEYNTSVAIGYSSYVGGNASVAILGNTRHYNGNYSHYSVAIGGIVIYGERSVGIVGSASANRSVAIVGTAGYSGTIFGQQSYCVAIGYVSAIKNGCVAIGSFTSVGSGSGGFLGTGASSVGIGTGIEIYSRDSIAIGTNAYIGNAIFPNFDNAYQSIAIGKNSSCKSINSIAIGYNANTYLNAYDSVAIGSGATAKYNNSIAIGNGITTTVAGGCFVRHRSPVASASTAAWVGNELVDTVSSMRFKQNIRDLEASSDKFDQIHPVRFNAKPEFGDPSEDHIGLIAEELEPLYPEFVVYEEDKITAKSIEYDKIVALLIKELQLEKQRRKELENRISALEMA